VRSFIDRNYERARTLLTENINVLHNMAKALIKYETIDAGQIDELMAGREAPPPKDWDEQMEPPVDPGNGSSKARDIKSDGSIGGPASQH
jgi:cell division protease FtsH